MENPIMTPFAKNPNANKVASPNTFLNKHYTAKWQRVGVYHEYINTQYLHSPSVESSAVFTRPNLPEHIEYALAVGWGEFF
jgi:hypothetical protein